MKNFYHATLLLTVLFFCSTGAAAQYVPDVHFEDEPIPSGTYTATQTVSARNATVESGSGVIFRAGQTVRLEAGFKAEAGATFRAEVDPSVGSGGGDLVLSDLPPHRHNARFEYEDYFKNEIVRPALSVRGFDAERFADGGAYGLGLKQILYRAYNDRDPDVRDALEQIALDAGEEIVLSPAAGLPRGVVNDNTHTLQCCALVALATYVLERNGVDLVALNDRNPDIPLPDSHAVAMARFRQPWVEGMGGLQPDAFRIFRAEFERDSADNGDPMKFSTSLMSLARAVDLYLALENAYKHYEGVTDCADPAQAGTQYCRTDSEMLLTDVYRLNFLLQFQDQITHVRKWGRASLEEIEGASISGKASYIPIINLLISIGISDENVDEVQYGNWPLITKLAYGYGSVGAQHYLGSNSANADHFNKDYDDWLREAIRSAGVAGGEDREDKKYWSYQTHNGQRFWAEGPYYFEYLLKEAIPFWHALRANDFGSGGDINYGGYSISNPFTNPFFTTPLHWLADITTPDGKKPPIDDGNKNEMSSSNAMRWSSEYGDGDLGRKFAWINEQSVNGGITSKPDLLPVVLAIPLEARPQAQPPRPDVAGEGERQLIIRRDGGTGACDEIDDERTGDCHYVFLNGESQWAINAGEGHEQPDNMQLLYYVNGTSVLMDSGYDNAEGASNSTWNHYYDHNVLNLGYGEYEYYDFNGIKGSPPEGGLHPPFPSLTRRRVVSSNHPGVLELYAEEHGEITMLHAAQRLDLNPIADLYPIYSRDVLFVDGSEPYLIDINWINHDFSNSANDRFKFRMNYYTDDSRPEVPQSWSLEAMQPVKWPNVGGDGRDLHLFPMSIEFPLLKEDVNTVRDLTREPFDKEGGFNSGDNERVRRLDLYDHARRHNTGQASFVSVIQLRNADPSHFPQLIHLHSHQHIDSWQGWVWKQSESTFDAFIVRSSIPHNKQGIAFNLRGTDSSFPNFELYLPNDINYGFARVTQEDGTWIIADGYQLGLEVPELMAEIDGPHAIAASTSATWTAEAYGGSGPYTYRWHVGPDPNSLHDTGVTTADYTHAATADFYLRVDVTSGSETAQSNVRRVYIGRPAPPSDLVLLNPHPGGEGENPRFAWQPSPTPDVTYLLYRCEGTTPGCNVADDPTLTNGEDDDVTIQDNCPNHQQSNTSYHVTASGTLGESDETNEVDLCGTPPPSASAEVVAARLEAASGQTVEAIPDEYALKPAYPNPFNPSATIRYALPEAADVRLVVYDVVGREVARLVEGKRPAGYHRVRFDGSRLASGLYLYRLVAKGEAGAFSKTGRMVLVK